VTAHSPAPSVRALIRGNAHLLPVISLGGALGSLARWGVAEAMPHRADQFPWPTWLVNVTGAFALGVLMALVVGLWPHRRYLRPFLGVGVLGGFTTFSTWMLDTRTALTASPAIAGLYVASTLVVGLLAVLTGLTLGREVVERRTGRHGSHGPHPHPHPPQPPHPSQPGERR
jgi:fluoride exporter